MENTGKQRHLYFMRVSENCQLLTELYVVPDECNSVQTWFEDRHLQEIIILLRDPIKAKVVSYYEQSRRKKWSGIKEGDSKKRPVPDEHQITTGQSVKIGYKFVDSNLHHHSCLMPTKLESPVWREDDSKHAGGGFSYARLFAKKLVVFVCKYQKSTVGQTTSQLMRSLCATPPSKHIAISSYFAPKVDDDFVGQPVTNSAHRKRNKLRKIVKGMNTASSLGTKENADIRGTLKGGGFFEREFGESNTETADEIKTQPSPCSSISEMDCNSDGMPDSEEQNKINSLSSTDCQEGVLRDCDNLSRRNLPLSPRKERSLKTMNTRHVKSDEYDCNMDGKSRLQYSDVSNISKPVKLEEVSLERGKEADVLSSEGAPPLQSHESHWRVTEVILGSSAKKKEAVIAGLACDSDVTEGSPSSSGDFDHRPKKKWNARVKNKLSLKRSETKKGCVTKLRSLTEKGLCEDGVKESVDYALADQEIHLDIRDVSKKQEIHLGELSMKGNAVMYSNNLSADTTKHPTQDCSVVLKVIKVTNHDNCWDDATSTDKSLLNGPTKNPQEILSPENKISPSTSSDDELISTSFLYEEKRLDDSVKEVKRSTLQTTGYGDNRWNGIGEEDSASNDGELSVTRSSPTFSKNKNQLIKKSKQNRLALSDRQKNPGKDLVQKVTKKTSHAEKKNGHRTKIQKLMVDLSWDSDSQETSQHKRPLKGIHIHNDKPQSSNSEEPMDVEDASPKTTPIQEMGRASVEVEELSLDQCICDDDQDASTPELKQGDLVHISDDSSGEDAKDLRENKRSEEEGTTAPGGASQEESLGDQVNEVIDLSQGMDDDDDSDSWVDNIFGEIRLVNQLKADHIVYLTQRNKKYLHDIFQGKRECERHQCYKKKGPQRIAMAGNVRLGPFKEEQMDAVMGELVKVYCAKHFKYMDYLSKVLLPEAMAKIYMDIHRASHAQAEDVMKGVQKEQPRMT